MTGISCIIICGGGDGGKVGGGGGGSFFSQFYTKIYNFQIAKKNFAVFFRFLPRTNAAIRGRGLEAEKRPNIAIVIPFLYISSQYLYYGMTIFLQPYLIPNTINRFNISGVVRAIF